ncbi:peptidylprolyl isomerase [Paenibacillus sp. strain BS8-2]
MRRGEVLKAVVIVQAICLIALTGAVLIKMWPQTFGRGADRAPSIEDGEGPDAIQPGDEAIASVGGRMITKRQLTDELYEQYGDAVLRTLMLREAMELEAASNNIKITQEQMDRELALSAEGYESEEQFFTVMEEQLGLTREQVLEDTRYKLLLEAITASTVLVTDQEVDAYIELHEEQFAPQAEYHLRWILTETSKQADGIIVKLADGESFEVLASSYSLDEFTREAGGDLGFIESGDPFYDSALLAEAGRLEIGEIAGPIAIQSGFAIIQLMGTKSTEGLQGKLLLDTVRKQIALEKAKPMVDIEEELMLRYNAAVMK